MSPLVPKRADIHYLDYEYFQELTTQNTRFGRSTSRDDEQENFVYFQECDQYGQSLGASWLHVVNEFMWEQEGNGNLQQLRYDVQILFIS